ncbi:ferredoxin [Pseudoprimorskyibacter insulae]|uniref:4Fe-4S ferredoxin-type domain-containing protein n=1 Tax=Pseudoprimorskyibacter insulae TaxID=1695997 RepID=A0A2R8APL3_9RHOB|nr:ferredoxin [Pseudoprimorskyibacter insulae]SPF77794.1 hypothetical protein PRI8871_00380 [Pseudoprimorskyibacter insulae]
MPLARYEAEARESGLTIQGALPHADGALLLLGPDEPGFWPQFTAAPEYDDGAPDPLDRWSKRVIGALAQGWQGQAFFPSDGPPFAPFYQWALDSGRAWPSPVNLLVHDTAGLWISYRGVVIVPGLAIPALQAAFPCVTCARQPCKSACPVGALTPSGYDVPRCKEHLRSAAGADCMRGCVVRRACPVSARFPRLPEQSAFHLRAFLTE